MSESAWLPEERRREALPRLEELPLAEGGYDRDAVRAAFDAFYRHAAELDSTLRTLEAVEAFQRQAGELRADIRALRAASWGPLPAMRSEPWYAGYGRRRAATGPEAAIADALPRVVVETAFIIAVAVGAGIADLGTPLVVGVIAAALLVVAAIEVVASFAEPRRARRARVVAQSHEPAEDEQERVAEPVAEAAAPQAREQERPVEAPASGHVGVLAEDEPVPAAVERPVDDTQADVALGADGALVGEPEALAPDTDPEPSVLEAERRWADEGGREPEPVATIEPQPVSATEPEQVVARDDDVVADAEVQPVGTESYSSPDEQPESDPWERGPELVPLPPDEVVGEDTPRPSRLRFWRRGRAPEPEEPPAFVRPAGHVEVIEVRPAAPQTDEAAAADELITPGAEPDAPDAPPARVGLRRGRR